MTPEEPSGAVGDSVAAGEHGTVLQRATDIVREPLGRCVAPKGLFRESSLEDRVEIGSERRLLRDRTLLEHGVRDLRDGPALEPVRKSAREQTEENDSERIDVARGRDRVTAHLLGARVLGSENAVHRRGALLRRYVQKLREAEVQELGDAAFRDEDVSRLEVAVHDEVLMSKLDGGADVEEEPKARFAREATAVRPFDQVLSLDVLHREPRESVPGRSAVVQARDVRVLERREDSLLGAEARDDEGGIEPATDHLQSNFSLEAGTSLDREIDGPHAAATELAQDLVRPDAGR